MEDNMARFIPFTVYVSVVPRQGYGKRFEQIRDIQKLSILIYDEILSISGIQVALPGGGQSSQLSDINRRGGLGGYANGTAVKLQMGESPAQLALTGFYEVNEANSQPWNDYQLISGGETLTGPGPHPCDAVPITSFNTNVKSLKNSFESAITAALPASIVWKIFRIDFGGAIYGDRGFHFPR